MDVDSIDSQSDARLTNEAVRTRRRLMQIVSPPLPSLPATSRVPYPCVLFIVVFAFAFPLSKRPTCYTARRRLMGIQGEKSNFNEKAEQEVTTRDKYRVSDATPPRGYVYVVCVNCRIVGLFGRI